MSKLISKPEDLKLAQNKISTQVRCKKDFEFLMNNFNRIKAELEEGIKKLVEFNMNKTIPPTIKEYSTEMQTIYKTSLKELSEFKKLLKETNNSKVVFTKFFETYPYCMPYRNLIKKL